MEYTSKGVGNAALATGIVGATGTVLGTLANAGGLAGILGGGPRVAVDPDDRPVTRYEMRLMQEIKRRIERSGKNG